MVELSLIRAFDVLFYPNLAYMIITCAIFAFGLAGLYSVLRPLKAPEAVLAREPETYHPRHSSRRDVGATLGHR